MRGGTSPAVTLTYTPAGLSSPARAAILYESFPQTELFGSMELVLNLLWLLLALPAWWVWRRQDRSFDSLRCVLVLACAIVLLFPVISCTDDLQAMRQEMEESTPSKRTLKQAGVEKSSARSHFTAPPAQLAASVLGSPCFEIFGRVSATQAPAPGLALVRVASGRAPPSFFRA